MSLISFTRDRASRAYRWMQLSVMLSAGIEPSVAITTLNNTKHQDNKALSRMALLLQRGQSFTSAFKHTGLLSKYELAMVTGADQAGRISQGLDHIARDRQKAEEQTRALATALLLPRAILLIAAVAAFFVRVAQFNQDMITAAIQVSLLVLIVFALTKLFLMFWSHDVRAYLSLLWPISFIKNTSTWFQANFEYNFYRSLNWQLQSGVAADVAVKRCGTMLDSSSYKNNVEKALKALSKGRSIVDSLSAQGLVLSARMKQTLAVANQTGTFEKSVHGELVLLKGQIDMRVEQQIKWLPKIYYILVLWFIFSYLF